MVCLNKASKKKKKKKNPARDVLEKLPKRGKCKRKSPDKNKASTGCVRETPQRKITQTWDV